MIPQILLFLHLMDEFRIKSFTIAAELETIPNLHVMRGAFVLYLFTAIINVSDTTWWLRI
jgi:hypothetical protein